MYTCQCKGCEMGQSKGVLVKELGGCISEVSFLTEFSLRVSMDISYAVLTIVTEVVHQYNVLDQVRWGVVQYTGQRYKNT